jgi:excisionase family DNA binding protein
MQFLTRNLIDQMDSTIANLFNEYSDLTGSAEAAATLVLAQVQKAEAHALSNAPGDRLLNLKEAAKYLGYDAAGLRKIVGQNRIRFVQNGRGPIKFRREWLDEFISENEAGPKDIKRSPAQRRRSVPIKKSRFGLDPKLFRPQNRLA